MIARLLHYTLWTIAFASMGVISLIVLDCTCRIALNHGLMP